MYNSHKHIVNDEILGKQRFEYLIHEWAEIPVTIYQPKYEELGQSVKQSNMIGFNVKWNIVIIYTRQYSDFVS